MQRGPVICKYSFIHKCISVLCILYCVTNMAIFNVFIWIILHASILGVYIGVSFGQNDLDFEIHPMDDVEGKDVSFTCTPDPHPCSVNPDNLDIQKMVGNTYETVAKLYTNGDITILNLTDGYSVQGRTNYGYDPIFKRYEFFITQSEIIDTGLWICNVTECSEQFVSAEISLEVSSDLNAEDIKITPPSSILLGSPAKYVCRSTYVYPEVDVIWLVDSQNKGTGTSSNKANGNAWDIENTIELTFADREKIHVVCSLRKTSGNTWEKDSLPAPDVPVFAPADISSYTVSHTDPKISDTLILECVVSGTLHKVSWKHKNASLQDGLFIKTKETLYGTYPFGETNATKSILTWNRPQASSCDEVNKHNGGYRCVASAAEGPQIESNETIVVVRYPPIITAPLDQTKDAYVGDNVTFECIVACAYPDELTYKWTSENDRDDFVKDGENITITVREEDCNDTFTCYVENSVDGNSIRFHINIIPIEETTPSEVSSEKPTTEHITTTEDHREPGNQALVTAFAVIWSLCGVFAILLVCLALYHYRQIQNGRKNRGEYSEEIILTDDEEKPGTFHGSGFGEYDDISPAIIGDKAVDGAVGGDTLEGMYAEVKAPGQTQVPVAPKRTLKVNASQPHPTTPKNKRTQAPATPNSPTDALRHDPISRSTGKRLELAADNTPVTRRRNILPQHSNESDSEPKSKVEQHQKKPESPNKSAVVTTKANLAKPSVPVKPNIQSFRSSISGLPSIDIARAGQPYDNAQVNLYANCGQHSVPKNNDGTITYADLSLQQEDLYDEGAPPVPKKQMTDHEPVQYASIKHCK